MITSASPSISAIARDRRAIEIESPIEMPTAPPPTSCGIDTSTGTPLRAPAPIIVQGLAPSPAKYSSETPYWLAAFRISWANRSVRSPIGHAMFPAALITRLPDAALRRSYIFQQAEG